MIILLDIVNSRGAPSRKPRGSHRDGEAWARRADGLWETGKGSDTAAARRSRTRRRRRGASARAARRAERRRERGGSGRPGHQNLNNSNRGRHAPPLWMRPRERAPRVVSPPRPSGINRSAATVRKLRPETHPPGNQTNAEAACAWTSPWSSIPPSPLSNARQKCPSVTRALDNS